MSTASRFLPPLRGGFNPGNTPNVTTPGSFAHAPDVGGPLTFSSPDAPGMPAPSEKTAWDFLPEGWSVKKWQSGEVAKGQSGKVAEWQSDEVSGGVAK